MTIKRESHPADTLAAPPSMASRRLAAALVVSLALHFVLALGVQAPHKAAPTEPIRATLIAVKEESQVAPPPAPAPKRASRPATGPAAKAAPRPKPRPVIRPTPEVAAPAETVAHATPVPESPPAVPAAVAETAEHAGTGGPSPADAAAEPLPAQVPVAPALRPERAMSQQGTIRYDLFLGRHRFLAGRSELTWEIDQERYRLSSIAETVGLVWLFYPYGLSSSSEGRITGSGFRPENFRVERGSRKGDKEFLVHFDWEARVARFGGTQQAREVPLPPGSLDLLSLICQLSVLQLTPGPMQLSLSNGRKLDTYDVEVGAEETLETPMGDLRAVYVKQVRQPGDEGIEVWLAVDYGYLPVRVRFTDRKGSIAGEQLVTEIQLARG